MAAMMGALITSAGRNELMYKEMMFVHKLLKDSGGLLTPEKACVLLDMSNEELHERLMQRSVLGLSMQGGLYIPAFQFIERFHLPSFHDVWDILHEKCSQLEVCAFFVEERLVQHGPVIHEILRDQPTAALIAGVIQKAQSYLV